MPTAYTSLLGLALPVTGELSGTWGDTVNNSITSLLDSAVAGTTTLSTDADVTLTTTTGAANQARNAVILWTASGTVTRNITAPAQSKAYVVINASGSTQSIVIRGVGPTTGVTVPVGRKVLVAWNGSDFVAVAGGLISLTTDVTGTLPVANGGTGQTTIPALSVPVANVLNTFTSVTPAASQSIRINSGGTAWEAYLAGTVTTTSVVTANGFAGTVATNSTTPVITLSTSISGVLKGNGTAISSATAGTDYVAPGTATTFTANQSFSSSGILLKGSSTGYTTFSSANTSATAYTVTFPAETMTVGFKNVPPVGTKTGSYTLATTDVGKYVQIGAGGSISIPDATFSEGDVISVFNNTTAAVTITCTITTAYIGGIDTDKASVLLAPRGVATILFISGTVCVISGNVS